MKLNYTVNISNPFDGIYEKGTESILFAHSLIGTVLGKSANGLLFHGELFNVVAIIDQNAAGKDTSKICKGVTAKIPIYKDIKTALNQHKARVLIILIDPDNCWYNDFEEAAKNGLDFINTSFEFVKDSAYMMDLINKYNLKLFDLRDLSHLKAYPDVTILNRKAKVVFVTGTDCGLGKRTAAFELTKTAIKKGINAVMYASGQTGLMFGAPGTVADALVLEFGSGVISQHICQLSQKGYELIFVEGQGDIYHPIVAMVTLGLLYGSNPDCIILVHDESRTYHKAYNETSELYKMHPVHKYITLFEMLSLPCGPKYKTLGIATIGEENIRKISTMPEIEGLTVADVFMQGGAEILLDKIIEYCRI